MTTNFLEIFDRDIARLKTEIETFSIESNLWVTSGDIKNSAGNLCLHLIGNLKTYIGKNLGGFECVRDRNAEFSRKNIPKQQLLEHLDETRLAVRNSLERLTEPQLEEKYGERVFDQEMTTGFFLLHLTAHLSYHLGQINYLRRIIDSGNTI